VHVSATRVAPKHDELSAPRVFTPWMSSVRSRQGLPKLEPRDHARPGACSSDGVVIMVGHSGQDAQVASLKATDLLG
jgi:hypothetical protein